ncbi:hypothetical protein GRI89_05925 [Altererythrobacter salegens]|uniref:Uncharacterized protein n=1 Tax=Croceibacterium salegens TaxID=1737568 RepID=A0A6I4SWA6_9SPHN|nr:hypothetical protein [Croceibacterium salegens]MXO59076.1 hypothetical protein [Croceibacterium salegens]
MSEDGDGQTSRRRRRSKAQGQGNPQRKKLSRRIENLLWFLGAMAIVVPILIGILGATN